MGYLTEGANSPTFRHVAAPGANELQALVEQIAAGVGQVLERRGGWAATLRRHGGRRLTDTPAGREPESTWTRLRRRKVVQRGIACVAGAPGPLQGLEYVA